MHNVWIKGLALASPAWMVGYAFCMSVYPLGSLSKRSVYWPLLLQYCSTYFWTSCIKLKTIITWLLIFSSDTQSAASCFFELSPSICCSSCSSSLFFWITSDSPAEKVAFVFWEKLNDIDVGCTSCFPKCHFAGWWCNMLRSTNAKFIKSFWWKFSFATLSLSERECAVFRYALNNIHCSSKPLLLENKATMCLISLMHVSVFVKWASFYA